MKTEYKTVENILPISYAVVSPISDNLIINSTASLKGKDVFVLENSIIADFLKTYEEINVITYKNDKELKKLVKNNEIIVIDEKVYDYNSKDIFTTYNIKYTEKIKDNYYILIKQIMEIRFCLV